jgi:hypothetical protein
MGFAEQGLRDDTIRIARKTSVERAEGQAESTTTLGCYMVPWMTVPSACGTTPQTQRCVGPEGKMRVERDHNGGRRQGIRTIDDHGRQTAMTVIDQAVLAVGGATCEYSRRRTDGLGIGERLRRRNDQNSSGVEAW